MNRVTFGASTGAATLAIGVAVAQLANGVMATDASAPMHAAAAGVTRPTAVAPEPLTTGVVDGARAGDSLQPESPVVEVGRDVRSTSAATPGDGAEVGGATPGEPLIVVGPALDTVASLTGGVPSVFQVGGSLVTARLALLPSEVAGPVLDTYVDVVDTVTATSEAVGQTATATSEATAPLGDVLNAPGNAAGGTLIGGVGALLTGTEDGATSVGVESNFLGYVGQTLTTTASAFGIDASRGE